MTDQKDIESVLYLLSARSDHASVEARNLITRLRAALVDETARLEAKPVRFKVEPWEDGEVVITADGSPCGATLSRAAAREAVRWLGSAWAELIKANRLHTDRIAKEQA